MGLKEDLAAIARQERDLTFDMFDERIAWELGSRMRELAITEGWAIVVDVRTFDRPLFFASLPGATPDNVDWARRKKNVVERFHRSSYAIGLELELKGTTLEGRYGLTLADFAAHGGAFPIFVTGSGILGCATVSGLPQREDHALVVRTICGLLGRDSSDYEFGEQPEARS